MRYILILATSLFVVGCGGGGSDSENIESVNVTTSRISVAAYQSITNPLDVKISFAPNAATEIVYGELEVFFDLNENGSYDNGDISLKAGNQTGSSFINSGERWTDGGKFAAEFLYDDNVYRFHHPRPFNIGGAWRNVSDVGGFYIEIRRENREIVSFDFTFRVNLDFSDNTAGATELKAALRTISSSTPRMVKFTDNASLENPPGTDSFDFLPAENMFTTENSLIISDPEGDYSGPEEFYDLIGIELLL